MEQNLAETPAHSASPQAKPPSLSSLPGYWRSNLSKSVSAPLVWPWQGYLAAGNVTLLTSQWKSGKTTLVAVLLAKMANGGELAGLPVLPGNALVISEESHFNWHQRNQKLHMGDHVSFLCRPFSKKPSREDWSDLVSGLVSVHEKETLNLVVIDPLVNFLPGHGENNADSLMASLLALQALTKRGVSILILHHPRKGELRAGQAARGSGVLGGYVDILLEMSWYSRPTDPDRRRVIEAYSRHEQTPRRLVIELTAEGTNYLSHGDLRRMTSHQAGRSCAPS